MTRTSGRSVVETLNTKGKAKLENEISARIDRRISEGWSLEKVGDRTCWTMYGLTYRIKGNILARPMIGVNATAIHYGH